MISLTINTAAVTKALEKYARDLHDVAQQALRDATDAAQASAKATIHATTTRRTGALEDKWSASWRGPYMRGLMSGAEHATFIDQGTKPHRIEASRAKVLAFQYAGGMMFRRVVNHPGTKPRPFIALAYDAGQMAQRDSARAGVERLARAF